MTPVRTLTAVTTAVVLALSGCSGGDGDADSRARTVPPATSPSAEAQESTGEQVQAGSGETLTEAQLEAALLTVPELPTGYTASAESDDEDDGEGGTTGEDAECSDRFEALTAQDDASVASVDADFEGGFGIFLQQELASFDDEGELQDRVDEMLEVLTDCPTFSTTDDAGATTDVAIGPLSFPELGDDTVALGFSGRTGGFDVRFNMVLVRIADNLMTVTQGGLAADPAALEQAARTGADKLRAAAGE